jgi:hypothetical protein
MDQIDAIVAAKTRGASEEQFKPPLPEDALLKR